MFIMIILHVQARLFTIQQTCEGDKQGIPVYTIDRTV
jgi:hypothetical protein